MLSSFQRFSNWTLRHPGLYLGGCCAAGLAIRWWWCGQDISRFINPLFPLFM